MSLEVCTIHPALKDAIQKFRFRKAKSNAAIIMKVNPETQELFAEDELDDVQDIDELRSNITETQPRFVLVSWKIEHSDGRISYPMAFIFITPRDCKPQLQMLYAGSHKHIVSECNLTKVFQIRDLEELDDEWIDNNLRK